MSDPNFDSEEFAQIEVEWKLPNDAGQNMLDFTVTEISMVESLLSPGLQTAIKVHSYKHIIPPKDFDQFKNAQVDIKIKRPILKEYGFAEDELKTTPTIYRLANRKDINPGVANEEMVFYACDKGLLTNAVLLESRHWRDSPSVVVNDILNRLDVDNKDIEDAGPSRDYTAGYIRPFEAIKQQSDVAITTSGDDPSFVFFMTYENGGTYHFKSLYNMAKESPLQAKELNGQMTDVIFRPSTAGEARNSKGAFLSGYKNPRSILQHSFPCDFDLVTDLLNGVNNSTISQIEAFGLQVFKNAYNISKPIITGDFYGVYKSVMANFSTTDEREAKDYGIEKAILKRQARMNLLDPDKVALRMTVPWNPMLHAGKVIRVEFPNLNSDSDSNKLNYGSGLYLISSLVHTVKRGGYSTTTMDCVAETVATGEV